MYSWNSFLPKKKKNNEEKNSSAPFPKFIKIIGFYHLLVKKTCTKRIPTNCLNSAYPKPIRTGDSFCFAKRLMASYFMLFIIFCALSYFGLSGRSRNYNFDVQWII